MADNNPEREDPTNPDLPLNRGPQENSPPPPPPMGPPVTPAFADEFPHEYHEYLPILDDEERKVVVSFFGIVGKPKLSLEEIAEVFRTPGIDTNKVRNQLSLAMGKLREAHDRAKLRAFHAKDKVAGD
jgi:hypothetical protein